MKLFIKVFLKGLKEYEDSLPELVKNTLVYVPEFKEKSLLLNFNNLNQQYSVTRNWILKKQTYFIKPISGRIEKPMNNFSLEIFR